MSNKKTYSAKSINWLPFKDAFKNLVHERFYFVCCKYGEQDYYIPDVLIWNSKTQWFHELSEEPEDEDDVFGEPVFLGANALLFVSEIVLP